jgi:hypothetical protein
MQLIFETNASKYEINTDLNLLRRLSGKHPPSPSQPPEGQWREYNAIDLKVDEVGIVEWDSIDERVECDANVFAVGPVKRISLEMNSYAKL